MPVIRIFAVIFYLFACLNAQASTPAINEEGAKHLKTMFESGIKSVETSQEFIFGKPVFDGEIEVETAESYYAVTLPFMTLQKEGFPDIKIGIIALNVTPSENDKQWNMAIALPTPIMAVDLEDSIHARFDIGTQELAGLWDEELNRFRAIEARYNDTRLTNKDGMVTLRLPALHIKAAEDNETKRYSGSITLKNLELNEPDVSITQLGSFGATFEATELPEIWLKKGFLKTVLEAPQPYLEIVKSTPQSFTIKAQAENFNTYTQGEKEKTAHLEKLDFTVKGKDLKTGKASLNTVLKYNDLESPFPITALDISDIDLKADLTDLPLADLNTMLENMKGQEQIAGLSVLLRIPALLSQAGTTLTIENPLTKGPDYAFSLDGDIKADLTALNSATVKGNARITGIDELTQRLQNYGEVFRTLMQGVKLFAKVENGENGARPVHTIGFSMDQTGKILINDKDIFGATKKEATEGTPKTEDKTSEH